MVAGNFHNHYFGRLEVYYRGRWGTVCDGGFSMAAANVACRQLGYPSASSYSSGSNAGNGTIWLDGVRCNGSESSIANCRHSYWGHNHCSHTDDIHIYCNGGKSILKI